ncbi:MAG: NAD(P)-binding domain-containing protein, partial [Candidatus Solibacter sp.]
MSQIGFIGLGIMGRPMSRNLMKAGHNLVVYDVVPALAEGVIADGAARGTSCSDVAGRSEVVITMLPDGPEVEQAILGPGGVLEGAKAGTIVVDMSSISPMVSQKVAAACAEKGVEFLDAPVSGGEPKAVDGTLAIMAGAKQEIFDKVLPILQKLGSSV